jgi:peptidoglycan L-alanyl-D-glutamate endopeptidase CwlK
MRDPITAQRVAKLHPRIRQEVADLITKAETQFPENITIRVVQGLRTIEEQDALYAQGRSKPGKIVTNARGGSSFHNYGLAIDFAILYDGVLSWDIMADKDKDGIKDWQEVVAVFKAAGYEYGGDWKSIKDYPHLQKTFGFAWKQLKAKYVPGEYVAV